MTFPTVTSRVFRTENFDLTSASMPSRVRKTAEFGVNSYLVMAGEKTDDLAERNGGMRYPDTFVKAEGRIMLMM